MRSQLNPPDFHAIFEVYIENGWWLIDPTRLAPIEGIVRIGSGRDASDIAFLTSDKQCQVIRQTIEVSENYLTLEVSRYLMLLCMGLFSRI